MNILITGGAGFIGTNAAQFFLEKNHNVTLFDNLSRKGADKNLAWLQSLPNKPTMIHGEIRDTASVGSLRTLLSKADLVIHLAAQVAVTTSVNDPRTDFNINALGTLNILEEMRLSESKAKFIYTSTNKVYGGMEDMKIKKLKNRYIYSSLKYGVSEERPLDFHSPYGCSKGAADQYVRDYARIYGIDTTVLRQSCIYGPHQFGVEDQGWVAWFIIALTLGNTLSIYGDGLQVRDLLYVTDLIESYHKVYTHKNVTRGQIYNIGGGMENTMSVWNEFGPMLESLFGKHIRPEFHDWRPGDQLVFVSDIRKAEKDFGWKPKTPLPTGIRQLFNWVKENKQLFI